PVWKMNPTQTALARRENPQEAAPQRALVPVNRGKTAFAAREPQADRLAVFFAMVKRDPLANANRGNSELCMQDFL
ncbi:MAG: hypothetical protein QXH30_02350, partial [Candidatus Bilamarchaeaceae archaeon]